MAAAGGEADAAAPGLLRAALETDPADAAAAAALAAHARAAAAAAVARKPRPLGAGLPAVVEESGPRPP